MRVLVTNPFGLGKDMEYVPMGAGSVRVVEKSWMKALFAIPKSLGRPARLDFPVCKSTPFSSVNPVNAYDPTPLAPLTSALP